jgi:hypothetical protein
MTVSRFRNLPMESLIDLLLVAMNELREATHNKASKQVIDEKRKELKRIQIAIEYRKQQELR